MKKRDHVKFCAVLCFLCVLTFLLLRQCEVTGTHVSSKLGMAEYQPSKLTVNNEAANPLNLLDKSWRRTNHIITQYRPEIAARVSTLTSRKAPADDPEVIQLARDVIDPVPATAANGIKRSHDIVKTPQAEEVTKIINGTRGGFFVECGALDGERSSNTIWLEDNLGWTGLLIEVDPFFYTQALGKNRRVYSINACLSPYKYISALPFRGHTAGQGRLVYSANGGQNRLNQQQATQTETMVPCFPLESLMAALNRTRIDYLSLDIEGAELDVLETIPWDRLDIRILSVEYLHGPLGKKGYEDFMTSKGYAVFADIHVDRPTFAYDYIFVKKQ